MTNFEYYKDEIYAAYEKYKDLVCEAFWRALLEIWIANRGNNINICEWYFQEHKESILDDAEKEYLKGIIWPLRQHNKITIEKDKAFDSYEGSYECITINFEKEFDYECPTTLPPFVRGAMYRGMELNKPYTLKELGL